MPKMKSHSGAKKRFRVTKNGKIVHNPQGKRHILTKKDSKRKMNLRHDAFMASNKETKTIRTMIQK